jgi:hypothetical protein
MLIRAFSRVAILFATAAATSLAACSSAEPIENGNNTPDSGGPHAVKDSGVPFDSGGDVDSGPDIDSGSHVDSGADADASSDVKCAAMFDIPDEGTAKAACQHTTDCKVCVQATDAHGNPTLWLAQENASVCPCPAVDGGVVDAAHGD